MLSDLGTKLGEMSDELRAVNGKLDDTISLLLVHRSNLLVEHQNGGMYGGGGGGVVASYGRGNPDPYGRGAPPVDYANPRLAIDQQHQHHERHHREQGWQGHQIYSQPGRQPSDAEQYPVTPNQVSKLRIRVAFRRERRRSEQPSLPSAFKRSAARAGNGKLKVRVPGIRYVRLRLR